MKRFQLRTLTMLAATVAALALGAPASATLLGNPLQLPLLSFDNTGTTTYQAADDLFLVRASPIAIRLSAGSTPLFVTPGQDGELVAISILVDDSGALIGGLGGGFPDLVVTGRVDLGGGDVRSGVLLAGTITGFGFQENGATDLFDFAFNVIGGALSDQLRGLVGVAMQSERSSFTGSFREDFAGGAKGTIGVIPEPTTLLLVSLGVAGLTVAGRRRTA